MTTVVTDGKSMMSDSQITDGSTITKYYGKVRKIGHNLVGVAGDLESCEMFFRWYANPTSKPPQLRGQFEALVVDKHGIYSYGKRFVPMKLEETFYAIGSGYKIALGALEAGANLERALEIAAKRDSFTGLDFVKVTLEEKKPLQKKRVGRKPSPSR